jgi:plasmid stabilization system protein ParE
VLPLRLRVEAADDVRSAHAWYVDRSPAAARRFLDAIDAAFTLVQSAPLACLIRHRDLRLAPISRFPYALVYRVQTAVIEMIAVAHHRRHPRRWRRRS